MAIQYVETQNRHCPQCNRVTIHNRNNSKANWLLHIVIGLVTCGVWLVLILVLRFLSTEGAGPWVCSICGTSEKQMSFLKRAGIIVLAVIATIAFLFLYTIIQLISEGRLKPSNATPHSISNSPQATKEEIETNTPPRSQPTNDPQSQPK